MHLSLAGTLMHCFFNLISIDKRSPYQLEIDSDDDPSSPVSEYLIDYLGMLPVNEVVSGNLVNTYLPS